MGDRFPEDTIGWTSPGSRTALLVVGWVLLVAAVTLVAVSWMVANPIPGAAGAAASLLAWITAEVLPDPEPADRPEVRDRRRRIAKLEGHQLPA